MSNKSRRQAKKFAANSQFNTRGRTGYGGGPRSTNFGFYLNPSYSCADTKRNVWANVGYPDQVDFDMLWSISTRGIGKAGIHRIVNKCWSEDPKITDGEFDGERSLTPFEQDLEVLIKEHHLFARLKGADWRNRIGRYAGIIPIVKDNGAADTELTGLSSVRSLFKLVPVFESQIDVTDVGTNSNLNDPRFGMPNHYNYRENVAGDRNPINNSQFTLHPSRVFVFAEGADDGSIFGVPANEAGFNSLLDMEKIAAASAEGMYKNAKQRTVINITDNSTAKVLTTDTKKREAFDDSVKSFERDIDGMLTVYGMDVHTLQSTLSDPANAFKIELDIYCATIEIPATILIGQQTGRLASDEDQKDWGLTAQSRCNNVLTPSLIIPFLKYMIEIGVMRAPVNDILVEWPNFVEASAKEKLEISLLMANVNKASREAGQAVPYPDANELRVTGGFEEIDESELEKFGEDDLTVKDELPA